MNYLSVNPHSHYVRVRTPYVCILIEPVDICAALTPLKLWVCIGHKFELVSISACVYIFAVLSCSSPSMQHILCFNYCGQVQHRAASMDSHGPWRHCPWPSSCPHAATQLWMATYVVVVMDSGEERTTLLQLNTAVALIAMPLKYFTAIPHYTFACDVMKNYRVLLYHL